MDRPSFLLFACSESFKIRSTESIVLQLRVVAGAPKKPSISPRYPIVLMWRRNTPNTSRFLEPMIRTNHFSPGGNAIGREALPRRAFDKILTKGTTSWSNGSAPKGFSISNRIRSRASQNETAASNGSFRRSSALGARHRLSNDKCSSSANVHDIIGGQVSCEHA
jgi:hypothetical protein